MTEEVWVDIAGCEGLYQVSNLGRVKSFARYPDGRILKPWLMRNGYLCVRLGRDKKVSVHRLVAEAFIPNPERKREVNHKNGDKTDNRVDNLEWTTPLENTRHAIATGLTKFGEDHPQAKLTNEQVAYVRENPDGLSGAELARLFSVCRQTITNVQCGRFYQDVNGAIRKPRPRRSTPTIQHIVNEK